MSVPYVLLALLSQGPKYGLQLREEFEAGTGEVWPLNVGQVYRTLGRLERDGLAESDGTGQEVPQKRFRITDDGREALSTWLCTPPDLTGEARDDLGLALVVDAELFRLDAVIRWLDAAEVRLARAAAEPPRRASAPDPAPQLRRLGARR